ncbi:NBS-type resistance protein RGC2 [Trifolium pratense]|uniref:NBS-type resistance protein RGC2 n=1 Tax=Trifolium pratense TaxID=57577 RepID=A0A2K3N8C7_TRIPR|nr:NBS-type resistance protein RGC2 [Trifolium pratense]
MGGGYSAWVDAGFAGVGILVVPSTFSLHLIAEILISPLFSQTNTEDSDSRIVLWNVHHDGGAWIGISKMDSDCSVLCIGSEGVLSYDDKEKEMGQCALGVCKLISSWNIKMGITSSRNRLPKQQEHSIGLLSHQVEVDIPSIKQETYQESSLVKVDITVNTDVTVLTNAPDTKTTHIREETPTIQNSDDEVFFETLKVSNASQLLSLPRNLLSLRIKGCESLDVLPNDLFDGLTFLKELELIDCSSLISIPYPTSLTTLNIRNCRNFELLPSLESRKRLSSIHTLSIGNSCDSLTTLDIYG